jgi:hypothetical protein
MKENKAENKNWGEEEDEGLEGGVELSWLNVRRG